MAKIPYGEVITFVDISSPARSQVGWVQNHWKPDGWHRVVFPEGRVKNKEQRQLLEAEGVTFGPDGNVVSTWFANA